MSEYIDLYHIDRSGAKPAVKRYRPHAIDAHDAVARFPKDYSLTRPKDAEVEDAFGPEFVADKDDAPADEGFKGPSPEQRVAGVKRAAPAADA